MMASRSANLVGAEFVGRQCKTRLRRNFRAGRDLVVGGSAAGERMRSRYNARCYHQTCDEFDPAWDTTGAAQEGSFAYALGREIADGRGWPAWNATEPFAAERARTDPERRP